MSAATATATAAAAAAAGAAATLARPSASVPTSWEDVQAWTTYLLAQGDPRVRDWPLMNPVHMAAFALGYLVLIAVLVLIMRSRATPFQPRLLATLHNIHLTLLSLYMCVEVVRQAVLNNYTLFGNAVDASPRGDGMARILWIFYVSKVAEFVDTILMALKKNFHQITFLHVYHHCSIFVIWWVIVYFAPGGESYFSAALNSFIHVVMYGYYLWSTYAPKLADGKRPTPCHPGFYRPYITTMQMTQFTLMLIQATYDLLVPSGFPRFAAWILFMYMFTMLGLFGNFFIQSYIKGGSKKRKEVKGTKAE